MRKRRVGATARSRRIVGKRATGSPQIATEMAAPLELRTPMGTAAKAAIRVRMEAWRQWRSGVRRRKEIGMNPEERGRRSGTGGRARYARMRRCLKLRQGASPLRPPAPFPSGTRFQNGGSPSRVRRPRNTSAPLTDSHRSEESTEMRERGPSARRESMADRQGGTARYARMRRCLILRQGARPLKPLCPS